MRFLKTAAVAVALGAACFAPSAGLAISPGPDPGQVCSEIGCESGLYASLGGLRTAFPNVKRVKVCLADRCRMVRRSRLDLVSIRGVKSDSAGKMNVRYVAYGRKGKVLGRDRIRAMVRKAQPNGQYCPPVCFQVSVWADDGGRLEEMASAG